MPHTITRAVGVGVILGALFGLHLALGFIATGLLFVFSNPEE